MNADVHKPEQIQQRIKTILDDIASIPEDKRWSAERQERYAVALALRTLAAGIDAGTITGLSGLTWDKEKHELRGDAVYSPGPIEYTSVEIKLTST